MIGQATDRSRPSRRRFLLLGAAAGGASLAACGGSSGTDTEVRPRAGTAADDDLDLSLTNTALSLELLAIETYDVALRSGLVTSPTVAEAFDLFRGHHSEHRAALTDAVGAGGGTPAAEPNAVVRSALVAPGLADAETEADLVRLALDLERALERFGVSATTTLSSPELRAELMAIGGNEARHAAILADLAAVESGSGAFADDEDPLPDGALVPSG
jgi:hypothetical protein